MFNYIITIDNSDIYDPQLFSLHDPLDWDKATESIAHLFSKHKLYRPITYTSSEFEHQQGLFKKAYLVACVVSKNRSNGQTISHFYEHYVTITEVAIDSLATELAICPLPVRIDMSVFDDYL